MRRMTAARRGGALPLALLACALAWSACAEPPPPGVRVGQPAPAFALQDLAGRTISSDSLAGTPTVLNFWAPWCLPCIGEMPLLERVQRSGAARVVGIAIDEPDPEVVQRFAADHHLPYPVLFGDDAIARRFAVMGIPYTVVVDPRGIVVATLEGAADPGELERAIRRAST